MSKTVWNLPDLYADAQAIQGAEVSTTSGSVGQVLTVSSTSPYQCNWQTPSSETTYSYSSSWSGPWAAPIAGTAKIVKNGNLVSIKFSGSVYGFCTVSNNATYGQTLPAELRPSENMCTLVIGAAASAGNPLFIEVSTAGVIKLYGNLGGGTFAAGSGNCGLYRATTISYNLV